MFRLYNKLGEGGRRGGASEILDWFVSILYLINGTCDIGAVWYCARWKNRSFLSINRLIEKETTVIPSFSFGSRILRCARAVRYYFMRHSFMVDTNRHCEFSQLHPDSHDYKSEAKPEGRRGGRGESAICARKGNEMRQGAIVAGSWNWKNRDRYVISISEFSASNEVKRRAMKRIKVRRRFVSHSARHGLAIIIKQFNSTIYTLTRVSLVSHRSAD